MLRTSMLQFAWLTVSLVLLGCGGAHEQAGDRPAGTRDLAAAKAPTIQPDFQCTPPTLDPTSVDFLTGDITGISTTQQAVDCYAWQTFIALNWPVDSAWPGDPSKAGEPDRTFKAGQWGTPPADPPKDTIRPAAWETFKSAQDVFLPKARKPTPWGKLPVSRLSLVLNPSAILSMWSGTERVMRFQNKFGATKVSPKKLGLAPDSSDEAFGGWLTDQESKLVWFERFVNRAEFEYIVDDNNRLYDATQQMVVATNSDGKHDTGIDLPMGHIPGGKIQTWDQLGAIEVKAAWRILTDQSEAWPRYHLTKAWLCDPGTNQCTPEILGLVGLHIIQKAASFPNFLWATFEHIDNVPDSQNVYTHPSGFSFNNPDCTGDFCEPNVARKPGDPKDRPVQTTREHPIPTTVMELNLAVQNLIREKNPKSVFQYYQLVNVLWQRSPGDSNTKPNKSVPLFFGTAASAGPNTPVANTSMETYAQGLNCTDCHKQAAIAGSDTLASDFSFLLGTAHKPAE